MPLTRAKTVLELSAVALLVLSGARIVRLDAREFGQISVNKAENWLIPSDSSPAGISVKGNFGEPVLSAASAYLLFLTVHARSAGEDIKYWNRVIELLNGDSQLLGKELEICGVCDSGAACSPYSLCARFRIYGYLDPYQMRALAIADAHREALLYDNRHFTVLRLPWPMDPRDEARRILRSIGQHKK